MAMRYEQHNFNLHKFIKMIVTDDVLMTFNISNKSSGQEKTSLHHTKFREFAKAVSKEYTDDNLSKAWRTLASRAKTRNSLKLSKEKEISLDYPWKTSTLIEANKHHPNKLEQDRSVDRTHRLRIRRYCNRPITFGRVLVNKNFK
jgi:hypothetical protein